MNYDDNIKNFYDYKKVLLNEKETFSNDVKSVFNKYKELQ